LKLKESFSSGSNTFDSSAPSVLIAVIYNNFYSSSQSALCHWEYRRGMEAVARVAIKRACVYPDRGSTGIIPNSSAFMFLFARSLQPTDCRE
jgi:hypothetical protein